MSDATLLRHRSTSRRTKTFLGDSEDDVSRSILIEGGFVTKPNTRSDVEGRDGIQSGVVDVNSRKVFINVSSVTGPGNPILFPGTNLKSSPADIIRVPEETISPLHNTVFPDLTPHPLPPSPLDHNPRLTRPCPVP